MNVFADFTARVRAAVNTLVANGELIAGLELDRLAVEPPRDASHGDIATNAAMILAKPAGQKPRDLAEKIAGVLRGDADVAQVDVAGPGFINMRLKPAYWQASMASLLRAGRDFARSDLGGGMKVNVEYVSANPTGPLHVGHCRGAVFGDALANLLERTGHRVTREYYINDAGAQIDTVARSVYLRYREALGEDIGTIPEGLYPGDYLVPVGRALAEKHDKSLLAMKESQWLPLLREASIEAMMALIREDLAALGIRHEVFFSEASLHKGEPSPIAAAIEALKAGGFVYEGRLPPPKGQLPEDWEDREQLLFRSTAVGDDIDRPLVKSDGSFTYFAADVAYFRSKHERGYKQMIYVLGADHGGYVKRLEAVQKAVAGGDARVIVRLCQLVKLFRGGEPVRMSKRAGDFITLREVVDEVGPDAVRFMMLYRKNDAPIDFDFVKVTEQSRDNPVFYVQYAHARGHSVLRNAKEAMPGMDLSAHALAGQDLSLLGDEAELGLMRRLAEYGRVLEQAALAHEPHRVAFYLNDVASDFHALWNRGKDSPQLRFINADQPALTGARLALIQAVVHVLFDGLSILGVNPVEAMR